MGFSDLIRAPFKSRVVTCNYPPVADIPDRGLRGTPVIDPDRSAEAAGLESVCPTGAIMVTRGGTTPRVQLDYGLCVFCGKCVDAAENGAIVASPKFELAARRRQDVVTTSPAPGAALDDGDALAKAITRGLKRSLHIRHLDSGSCNGCDWEITALLNPVYDIQRLGIDFVASPRHADLLLVTGVMTRNLAEAARLTYEAMPEPRLVVAVGACGVGGGVFARTYAAEGEVGHSLPVDVFVPGCPPRPEAIIHGLLVAVGKLGGD
jgi:Ni,Fe-hydrogenase III small subunit/formate hydrogenlyase subunit 6/NADH:ubiquinone oxidoreductase subunit I